MDIFIGEVVERREKDETEALPIQQQPYGEEPDPKSTHESLGPREHRIVSFDPASRFRSSLCRFSQIRFRFVHRSFPFDQYPASLGAVILMPKSLYLHPI